MIFENDFQNVKDSWLTGTKLLDLNYVLFNALVPGCGKADTTAGERVRSVNHTLYRYNNDGDVPPYFYRMDYKRDLHKFLYEYLDKALTYVIGTKAGKAALRGTEFEYLIK